MFFLEIFEACVILYYLLKKNKIKKKKKKNPVLLKKTHFVLKILNFSYFHFLLFSLSAKVECIVEDD